MNNCAFTICAKNYIGLALIMEKSLKQYNHECDFYIFVADEFNNKEELEKLQDNIIISKGKLNISNTKWNELSFKYNLTEFCTAIKPYCFQYLFENMQYNSYIYFDPDIYFFNSLSPVFDALSKYSIVITPHILNINIQDNGENTSDVILFAGVYNLGFLALKKDNNSKKLIQWWCRQLDDKCYIDSFDGYFTDQKWMNLMSAFFDENILHIIRHKGLNVAPWNYYEREIVVQNNELFGVRWRRDIFSTVDNLIFIHYSGYDYSALKNNIVIQKNISQLPNYKDIEQIIKLYALAINEQKDIFDRYINYSYTYNFFENGALIDSFHRRIYRGLITRNESISNPFSTTYKNNYFQRLRKSGLIDVKKNDVSVDKISHSNINSIDRKLSVINSVFKIVFKILKYRNYQLLIRFFPRFSRFESQIYLIDNKYKGNNLFYK
jgi:hypothetical protein